MGFPFFRDRKAAEIAANIAARYSKPAPAVATRGALRAILWDASKQGISARKVIDALPEGMADNPAIVEDLKFLEDHWGVRL